MEEYQFEEGCKYITKMMMVTFQRLKRIVIPSGVEKIDSGAFDHLSLEHIVCDGKWLHLFGECTESLKSITVPNGIS